MQQDYWFKRRRYGYGWIPSTWQGWAVLGLYLVLLFGFATAFLQAPEEVSQRETGLFTIFLAVSTATLLIICFKKGPKPKWRWGQTSKDNPLEDM